MLAHFLVILYISKFGEKSNLKISLIFLEVNIPECPILSKVSNHARKQYVSHVVVGTPADVNLGSANVPSVTVYLYMMQNMKNVIFIP